MIYNNPKGVRAAIAAALKINIDEVELAYTGEGFKILRPAGANPDPNEVAAWEPPVAEPDPIPRRAPRPVGRRGVAKSPAFVGLFAFHSELKAELGCQFRQSNCHRFTFGCEFLHL